MSNQDFLKSKSTKKFDKKIVFIIRRYDIFLHGYLQRKFVATFLQNYLIKTLMVLSNYIFKKHNVIRHNKYAHSLCERN